ncbi:MAG: response regulator [Elusimicrobia bacterium]|nr:response regulator [Elusimicrobiota bacterium]
MKRVLVVDDDEDMRELMVTILGGTYQVSSAEDGLAGLLAAKAQKPDLVVLDLLMPKMHGFEVCMNIRADDSLKATKVLISSSKSYQHDVRTAVEETGADAYIVKPFAVAEFKKKVAELLGEKA